MDKRDYTEIAQWMADKGYFATLLPKLLYECDIYDEGITYTESFTTISIGEWPCGFTINIIFEQSPIYFSVSRTADFPIGNATAAIDFLRDCIEELFDEYEMNLRTRFHNGF